MVLKKRTHRTIWRDAHFSPRIEGGIRQDVIVALTGQPGITQRLCRGRHIRFDDRELGGEAIGVGVPFGQSALTGINLNRRDMGLRHPRQQTEARDPNARPRLQHAILRAGGNRRGQKYGIATGAMSGGGLADREPSAEKGVGGGVVRFQLRHRCPVRHRLL
jgi:hypothetical protein